jgi:hypothetical protein
MHKEFILFRLIDLQNHKDKLIDLYGIIPAASNYILENRIQGLQCYDSVIICHNLSKFVRSVTNLGDHLKLRGVAYDDKLGFEVEIGQMLYNRLNKTTINT